MKILSILILGGIGFLSLTAKSATIEIDCNLENIFCLQDFSKIAVQSLSVEETIEALPTYLKRNLTFKRGNNIEKRTVGIFGPHGHKVSSIASQSSSPGQPRVFVWDEKSGFTLSWNSGNPDHSAFDRVDLYDFDFKKNEHRLMAWFPTGNQMVGPEFKDKSNLTCMNCHGQVQRPIFPMYPDWPQFYGEFNDELAGYPAGSQALRSDLRVMANEFQPLDRASYLDFLNAEGQSNPRFSAVLKAKSETDTQNKFYPYRPRNTTAPFADVSRAFHYRPNLRLGVLYNRLTALQTFEKIKKSPVFRKFPDIVFYSLLDCNWDMVYGKGEQARQEILGALLNEIKGVDRFKAVNLRGAKFPEGPSEYRNKGIDEKFYQQIPYEDLLQLLDLNIADLDIRFRHDSSLKVNKGYNVYDPRAFYFTDSAMDIGYIDAKYAMNPTCDNNNSKCYFSFDGTYMQGARYFNSYFDGSATMNELLAAQMLSYLVDGNLDFSNQASLKDVRDKLKTKIPNPSLYFETLQKKYSNFSQRLDLDKEFFGKMDRLSPWIQLPFSPDLLNIQNREAFWGAGAKTENIRLRHAQWASLSDRINNKQNRNGGQNLCWNVYDVMHARYRK